MDIGTTFDVLPRTDDGLGAVIGQARLLLPRLAQALPPLDETLTRSYRSDLALVLRDASGADPAELPVRAARPCLVPAGEAAELFAAGCPGIGLVLGDVPPVALELAGPDAADPPGGDPWLCKIFCMSSCHNCS